MWRAATAVLLGILLLGFLIRLSPLFVWWVEIAPGLRLEVAADRLSVHQMVSFPAPQTEWSSLRVRSLMLRAPVRGNQGAVCARCADRCQLELDEGTLSILPETSPTSYQEALDTFAADERDLSPLRSPQANWSTIVALAARVRTRSALPRSFRYEASESKGLVTLHHASEGAMAMVVYAYTPGETAQVVIGLVGVDAEDAYRIIGSIDAGLDPSREQPPSECRASAAGDSRRFSL